MNKRLSSEEEEQIVSLFLLGYSKQEIASALNRSVVPVYRVLNEYQRRTPAKEIDAARFVVVWQTSATLEDVCRNLRITKKQATARAVKYRQEGVPLKKHQAAKVFDWQALAKLAESIE